MHGTTEWTERKLVANICSVLHSSVWGEPHFFVASQADTGVCIQWVVVAMETVNNPAAYTGAPPLACTLLLEPF